MQTLETCINQATNQAAIVDALKRYHQLDRVVAYIGHNYNVGYNDDQQIHPEHRAVPLEELKSFILAALLNEKEESDNAHQ